MPAGPLAMSRVQSSMQLYMQRLSQETPNVQFAQMADPLNGESIHALCQICKAHSRYGLAEMNSYYGRGNLDNLLDFAYNFTQEHKHRPAAESPTVSTEQATWAAPDGRKFCA